MPEHYAEIDKPRLKTQLEAIREVMLSASECGNWHTLEEITALTGAPPSSASAQLRHLRKPRFGGYVVEKRPRGDREHGLWEYQVAGKRVQEKTA
jgi:hypothetical protein